MTDKPNTKSWKNTRYNVCTIAFPDWQVRFMKQMTDEEKFISRSEFVRFLVSMYHRDICRLNKATPEEEKIVEEWRRGAK